MSPIAIRQALRAAAAALPASTTPELDAEVLLAHTLGISRAALLAGATDPLVEPDRSTFEVLVTRRAAGEPVAYLTGRAWFYGLALEVTPEVLIPRPETEGVVEWGVEWIDGARPTIVGRWVGAGLAPPNPPIMGGTRDAMAARTTSETGCPKHPTGQTDKVSHRHGHEPAPRQRVPPIIGGLGGARPRPPKPLTLLDIGTGSGAIALALAAKLPADGVEIHATDISPAALAVARRNAASLGLVERIAFHHADLLPPAPPAPPRFDLVVANLPYVGTDELAEVAAAVLGWEPQSALFAGTDGLEQIRRLLDRLPARLRPGGALGLEIGWRQGAAVVDLARAAFPGARVALRRDLAGLDRIVTVQT